MAWVAGLGPAAAATAEAALAATPAVIATGGTGRGLLRQGLREHLGREVELLAKELDPLVRQEVVVPPPVVDLRAVRPRGQATLAHRNRPEQDEVLGEVLGEIHFQATGRQSVELYV